MTSVQIVQNAWGIVAAPFLAGFLIILFLRKWKTVSMLTSIGAVVYGFIHSCLIFNAFAQRPELATMPPLEYPFFVSHSFVLSIGVLVDNLAVMMLLVVTSVSLLVQIYTHGYMREDPGYSRFYSYLSLFTGSMLGLVVATNLFQTYFFWELVGVCSYFLIGFWWYKNSAAAAALKAFVVNRVGDALFLVGILMLFVLTKDYWHGHTLLAFSGVANLGDVIALAMKQNHMTYWGVPGLAILSLLIFCGPVAKSAQVPLHVWLPDAMEGPTPISALIHAATMVAAGVYLVARAYPLWLAPEGVHGAIGLNVIAWVGGITAFMAATIAMSQNDIKRALAWSTCSQLGYMFVGLGVGAYTGGLFHLFNHAFFKAMLFLCSGAVIHGVHGEQDMRQMGGLRKYMPITANCFLIGTISISGCPFFSGFFSKDTIIAGAWAHDKALAWLMILTAGLTAFYMFRAYFMTFHGEYRGHAHPHEAPISMTAPLMVLAVPSICSGYLGFNATQWTSELGKILSCGMGSEFHNAFGSFVYFNHAEAESINGLVLMLSVAFALVGFVASYLVYCARSWNINTTIVNSMPTLYQFSLNKWYWDEMYLGLVKAVLATFNGIWNTIDMLFVDTFVNGTASVTAKTGSILRYTQNGQGQYYALMIFGWVALLTIAAYFLRP